MILNKFQQPYVAKIMWHLHDVIKVRDFKTHRRQWSIRRKLGGLQDVEQEIVNPKFDANWSLFWFLMIFSIIIFIITIDFVHKMRTYANK